MEHEFRIFTTSGYKQAGAVVQKQKSCVPRDGKRLAPKEKMDSAAGFC
jgi:hypothetical protein